MPPTNAASSHDSWVARCAWGVLPILVCILFLRLARESSPQGFIVVSAACAVILWFGWGSVRRNSFTKWIGVILGLYFGLILGLAAFAIVVRLALILLPVFFVILPLVVYDLLFRAPSEGQAERDRAERSQLRP